MLVDDFTHYVWTFPLRAKSNVFTCLVAFHAYIRTQFQLPLLALQTDNGKEFDNLALHRHCESHGIALRCLSLTRHHKMARQSTSFAPSMTMFAVF